VQVRRALLAAAVLGCGPVRGSIHLELRPVSSALVGETVEVGLYAVSDDMTEQSIGGIDAIVQWDPDVVELLGRINNGPYSWGLSWFPDDGQLDGVNDSWTDGDALYQCLRRNAPSPPAMATPAGLLVTTFRFVAVGPASAAPVRLVPHAGTYSTTRVLDGFDSSDVTGTLRACSVTVLLCGLLSDLDADCDVDSRDFAALSECVTGPAEPVAEPSCGPADLDGDGAVDLRDLAWLQLDYMGL
jgi:hypothetical protein